jgi:hypothetical protein
MFGFILQVLNPRVHLQGDGYTYSFGVVRFTCVTLSSLVSITIYKADFLKGSKHVEEKKN